MIDLKLPPKIFQTREDLLDQTKPVLELLILRKYQEARKLADRMVKEQVPPTRINRTAWHYVTTLARENQEEAKKLTYHFAEHPYHWQAWIKK